MEHRSERSQLVNSPQPGSRHRVAQSDKPVDDSSLPPLERSRQLWHEAEQLIWKGGPEAKQHDRLAEIGAPNYASRAEGAHFWDADGNNYLDYLMAWGTVLLGHNYVAVSDAAAGQIRAGALFNISAESEVHLARRLVGLIPGADVVRFLLSGSEATSAAVRIARAATNRIKVIKYGFHGWLEWNQDEHPTGVLPSVVSALANLKFNDIDQLKSLFSQDGAQVACVIMEPIKDDTPNAGYLQEVKDLVHENGAILIFDEVKTGFRLCAGGAQQYFGVTADICVFSKAIANGFPLSVVSGNRGVFMKANDVWVNGTYHGWLPSIAAAHAVIDTIGSEPVYDTIWRQGSKLMSGFNECMARHRLQARLRGLAPMPRPRYPKEESELMTKIFRGMMGLGHYLHPNHAWFISYSHKDEDIENTLSDLEKSVAHACTH